MENSAVNFLKEEIQLQVRITQSDYNNDVQVSTGVFLNVLKSLLKECEQAKEMEKQQIEDAHISGFYSPPFGKSRNGEAEQYYNETFKNTKE